MIRVQEADFDPGTELDQLRDKLQGSAGAVVSFIGLVRDLNEGDSVSQLTLEHYPGMTEKALGEIRDQACQQWNLLDALIIHRVGPLEPNDRIVFVAAACAHRGDAFRACEYMIDTLKTDAPFWKKEVTADHTRWLSGTANNTT